jgi:hypothetical protein
MFVREQLKGPGIASSAIVAMVSVLTPAKFETRSEQVVKVAETKRFESVLPTFKNVTEVIVVKPEMKLQIPVPASYKEESAQVLVRPESYREEPIPAQTMNAVNLYQQANQLPVD